MKIKNCPFCGNDEAELIEGDTISWVACNKCRAEGPTATTPTGAIGRWNNAWREMGKHERVNKNES